MKPTEVFDVLRDILEKAGLADCVSISSDKNESAELMWFSSKEKNDYLAIYDTPLFPISCIENITYEYKRKDDDRLVFFKNDALCILRFHLNDNYLFIIEFDEDCCPNLYFNSSPDDNTKWIEDEKKAEFYSAISQYTLMVEKQEFYEDLITALFAGNGSSRLDVDLCEKQHRIIFHYLQNNQSDEELLFLYAYEAAYFISGDYKEYPYLSAIIKEVKRRGLIDKLLVYVRKRCFEYNWFDNDVGIYYSSLQSITENIMNQLKSDDSDSE